MRIDPDTFEEWQAHPITQLLYRVCDAAVDDARERWMAASLEGGRCDPAFLKEITTRIAVFKEVRQITASDIEERLQ